MFRDGFGSWLELPCCTSSSTRGSNRLAILEIICAWSSAHNAIEPRYLVPSICVGPSGAQFILVRIPGTSIGFIKYLDQPFQRHVHTAPINVVTARLLRPLTALFASDALSRLRGKSTQTASFVFRSHTNVRAGGTL